MRSAGHADLRAEGNLNDRFRCAMSANSFRGPSMTLAGKALQKEASQSRSGVILS
jgi:hypothetical protein